MLLLSGSTFLHVCIWLLIGTQLVRLNSGLEIASAGTHTYTHAIRSCLDFGGLGEPQALKNLSCDESTDGIETHQPECCTKVLIFEVRPKETARIHLRH
jgi:hypothetical protein